MKFRNYFGWMTSIWLTTSLAVVACGPDSGTEDDGDTGDETTDTDGSTGGDTSTGGASNTGGSDGSGTGGDGTGGGTANEDCPAIPGNPLLTDFSSDYLTGVMDGDSWDSGHDSLWGSSETLTGGDVFYTGGDSGGATLTATLSSEELALDTSLPQGDYTGYMFSFGPACNDASGLDGMEFDISGSLGGATLKVQLQQVSNYPEGADPSRPGSCTPESTETQWSDCLSPAAVVAEGEDPSGTISLAWSDFSGGAPVDEVLPSELMAIQWQFECPTGEEGDTCDIAVTLDNVTFY